MKIARIARLMGLGTLLCFSPVASALGRTPALPKAVALIYSLAGDATLATPAEARRPLRLFDRLVVGTTVEVGSGARLALAFANGRRYELGEQSRATLGRADFSSRSGSVRSLPTVPPLPLLAAIADHDRPGLSAGAVRIRSATISGLYPDRGAASLASATRLYFDPSPAAPKFRVRIIDRMGKVVFGIDTQAAEVTVPAGVLAPGRIYRWTVETVDRPGPVARGEAILVTVDAGRARAREKLRRWAQASGGADDLSLLEGVDLSLGLQEDSRPLREDARCPFSSPGVVVETVALESAAFRVGLMPGDRLFSWCRSSREDGNCVARGELRTPFDWLDLQMEDVQRGGVVVEGRRGSEDLRWNLLPTFQGLTVASLLDGPLADANKSSRDRELAGDLESAAKELERAAELADENHCDAALWLRVRAAQLRAKARKWPEADAGYESVVAKAQALGAARVEAHLQMGWSETLLLRGDVTAAKKHLERALQLEGDDHPECLGVAAVLLRLGNVAERQDNLEEADRLYRRAYDLVLREAPGSGGEAAALNNLAVISGRRGDLAQAEKLAARALAIREKLTPSGEAIIPSLVGYGNLLYARGDFAGAEVSFLRARRILERVQPESVSLATILHNLGELAYERGDRVAAEDLFQRELALFEKLDPSGSLVRDSLVGLGEVALREDQGGKAEELLRKALAISEKLNPTGPKSARCLRGLAAAAKLQGRSAEAEKLLRQALAIWQKLNPEAAETGDVHLNLGLLLLDQGRFDTAEAHLRTAIVVYEKNRRPLPEGHHALARLQAKTGRLKEAGATYQAAMDALETQRSRLGGAKESQWLYRSTLGDLYFEAAEHEISLRHPDKAWRIIERGRARGFQEVLSQRDLRFSIELPEELYVERHRLDAEYDRVQAALAEWVPEQGPEKIEMLQGRLRDLRLEQAEVQERVQRSSPRLGTMESSIPLDIAAARSALDPGTVLLTYAVGESHSFLFVVAADGSQGPGLSFYPLLIGREGLTRKVEEFRRLVSQPQALTSTVKQNGRQLYDLLVHPAEPLLAKADRLLISPDGPLHSLPFAALVSKGHYFAESKPIHVAASAKVYKEIKASRSKGASVPTTELLAVGDPVYPEEFENESGTERDPQVQTALRRGLKLESLPATRGEVKAISDLFPEARVLLGREATEEAIKSLAPKARRLHFACHGLLDQRFPLNSALALSIPDPGVVGRDNGLLQAWEIFEGLRLDAELVTLSACDSGLGQEMGGEGLVGLVRAFQFAGARSVLASLWSVSDLSTADLMKRFYGNLRAGKAKDEALQVAQVAMIRSPEFSHPYYWAAFQLVGDWK